MEAACEVGEVHIYRELPPEKVAGLAQTYDLGTAKPYFERYIPPNNLDRPVNVGVIELLNVRKSTLPPEVTPRHVMSGWVAHIDADAT